MLGSLDRTRNTFPDRAARNFAGIVSRFFASSVCSKVPWKAIHVPEVLGASRTEVAEWEEPRHPGPAVRADVYPTLSHFATPRSTDVPLDLSVVPFRPPGLGLA